jgi:hypothetical protein
MPTGPTWPTPAGWSIEWQWIGGMSFGRMSFGRMSFGGMSFGGDELRP